MTADLLFSRDARPGRRPAVVKLFTGDSPGKMLAKPS
jgi:hypothetical protein